MVNLTIDGKHISVEEGTTILKAAEAAGIRIPTLCKWDGINVIGACRLCIIEVKGMERLPASCVTIAEEGMEVYTSTQRVIDARRANLEMILSEHDFDCINCPRSGTCELQKLVFEFGIEDGKFRKNLPHMPWPKDFPLIRNNDKCIKCMRCVQVCEKIADVGIWDVQFSGSRTTVWTKDNKNIKDMGCTLCGQCITHCPCGALTSRDDRSKLFGENGVMADKSKIKVVSMAPSVRTAWAEEFGLGNNVKIEKLVGVLKALGFNFVFDVNFGADLTIMEEGNELIERLSNRDKYKFPMFTSCCPAWVRYVKTKHKELIPNLSTAKSPNQMQGAIIKTYFAEKLKVNPATIYNVAIMPCVAKKAEIEIPTMNSNDGVKDVDLVLTTRELVSMIKEFGIDINKVEEKEFDSPLGESTGAGVIFGSSGGVLEASLRTASYVLTKKTPTVDEFKVVRNKDGIKIATVNVGGTELKVGVVSGLKNASKLIKDIENGKEKLDFIEVMACPNGCINGGGQPIWGENEQKVDARCDDIYRRDRDAKLKNSYENPSIVTLYNEYIGKPCGEKAHHLLHIDHESFSV